MVSKCSTIGNMANFQGNDFHGLVYMWFHSKLGVNYDAQVPNMLTRCNNRGSHIHFMGSFGIVWYLDQLPSLHFCHHSVLTYLLHTMQEYKKALTACLVEMQAFDKMDMEMMKKRPRLRVSRHTYPLLEWGACCIKFLAMLKGMQLERVAECQEIASWGNSALICDIIDQQQQHLDHIDSHDRECKAIIAGIPEDGTPAG